MPAQTTLLNVEAFDARAVELGDWRWVRQRRHETRDRLAGYERVPSNTRIARRLHVSQATVSRARRGLPVSSSFVAAAIKGLGLSYAVLFHSPTQDHETRGKAAS